MISSKVQEACLRLLDRLIAFEDVNGRKIGEQFCCNKHPELYTKTYLPSLDEIRLNVLENKLKNAEAVYQKVGRCFTGLQKQDPRFSDAKSLNMYLVYLWMQDEDLPLFKSTLALFDTSLKPAPLSPRFKIIATTLSHGNATGKAFVVPYLQLLEALDSVKDTSGAHVGRSFVNLPEYDAQLHFFQTVQEPLDLQKVGHRATRGVQYNGETLYQDCMKVFEDFENAWRRSSSKWRDALYMKVWCSIPGLPVVEPVRSWTQARVAKIALADTEDSPSLSSASIPNPVAPPTSEAVTSTAASVANATTASTTSAQKSSVPVQPVLPIGHTHPQPEISSHTSAPSRAIPSIQSYTSMYMSTKIQTPDEIARIIAAPPIFLTRVARARRMPDLQVITTIHREDGSASLIPSMTGQPQYLSDDVAKDYNHPGLPYLLDILFDEQASGIRINPARTKPAALTRGEWAMQAIRDLFKDSETVPQATMLNELALELYTYSVERHDQEVDLEMQATQQCLAMLKERCKDSQFELNLGDLFRTRADYFYRIWHRKALELLQADTKDAAMDSSRLMTMMSQASAAAAILAYQLAALDIVLRLHNGNVNQVAAIFETGITASSAPIGASAPPIEIAPDVPLEPGFQYEPYKLHANTSEMAPLVRSIAKDMRSHNRLTPQARDLVLAYIQGHISMIISDVSIRSLLLGFLSFYPEHIGLHITLSCCYAAKGQQGVQAYLCKSAGEMSERNGSISSEALTNLAIARMNMNESVQALSDLDKACKVKPTNWEALYNIGYLMTQSQLNGRMESKQASTARQYYLSIIHLLCGESLPLKNGKSTSSQLRLPRQVSLRDICKLQEIFLTMGALAMESGHPELALADYVQGIEIILCGQANSEAGHTSPEIKLPCFDEDSPVYKFSELLAAINFHVQYLWLEHSAGQQQALKCHRTLLAETDGLVDRMAMRRNCLKYLRKYPKILESEAVPFRSVPLLLLLPKHITELARSVLHAGQSNELVIPPIAFAEQVNPEWRRLADIDATSVLADLVLAVCQVLDLHLTSPSPSTGAALSAHLGCPPSQACLLDLYYFSVSLKAQVEAIHNLAVTCARLDPGHPPTRLVDSDNNTSYHTPADYAYYWMELASRAQPSRGAVFADTLQAIRNLRELHRQSASTSFPPSTGQTPVANASAPPDGRR